ncbi:hypothetical protein ASE16_03540 [Leifsonia sp. Root227]|nr:hypothetical protein ASE16_03540 [Leifsonia sp. Root227]
MAVAAETDSGTRRACDMIADDSTALLKMGPVMVGGSRVELTFDSALALIAMTALSAALSAAFSSNDVREFLSRTACSHSRLRALRRVSGRVLRGRFPQIDQELIGVSSKLLRRRTNKTFRLRRRESLFESHNRAVRVKLESCCAAFRLRCTFLKPLLFRLLRILKSLERRRSELVFLRQLLPLTRFGFPIRFSLCRLTRFGRFHDFGLHWVDFF